MVVKEEYVTWINKYFQESIAGLYGMYDDTDDIPFIGWEIIH